MTDAVPPGPGGSSPWARSRLDSPRAIVFTGLPGTGKSTVAEAVARKVGVACFAADWLFGAIAPTGMLNGADVSTLVDVQSRLLGMLAERQVSMGQSVVLDGLFSNNVLRSWASRMGAAGGTLRVVQCVCGDETLHRARLEGRTRGIPGWHEVDWDHVLRVRGTYPAVSDPDLVLNAVDPLAGNVERAIALLRD